MEPILKYIDYHKFLAEYYYEKKKNARYFSYHYLAQKAGFKSPNFLKQVIE